jgi:muramoyltetrapeptide carboxypeptidase LdcA involved in peptidoglycan recycling
MDPMQQIGVFRKRIVMIKNVAIVSLSSGTIGEDSVKHKVAIGLKRLEEYGLHVTMMPYALKGIDYVKNHPEDRAADLLAAFQDERIDMILCAMGGNDTYRLLPYLFENNELKDVLSKKIFLGFSDTTMNHFMLHKLGLNTFYGQSFLADICELDETMLPYTAHYFEELIKTGSISKIVPSDIWYEERKDSSEKAIGTKRIQHDNKGFELLQGYSKFRGAILGGCLESMYDMFDNILYADTVSLCEKYQLFPAIEDWKGKILLLETSGEKSVPALYRKMLLALKATGIFDVVNGVICGKPMDESYFEEYKEILIEVIDNPELPVVVNVNIGHATPRCIIPFGVEAEVDVCKQQITFCDDAFV